jgi:hypothetical protein
MNKMGMTPMDVHSLLTSLEAIERICIHEKAKLESSKKISVSRVRKGRKVLVPSLQPGFPRKSASSLGMRIPHTTLVIVVGLRKTERKNLISAPLRKAGKKRIPLIRTSRS